MKRLTKQRSAIPAILSEVKLGQKLNMGSLSSAWIIHANNITTYLTQLPVPPALLLVRLTEHEPQVYVHVLPG